MPPASRTAPPTSRAPWLSAAILGVLAAVLVIVYFAVLLPDRDHSAVGGLSSDEQTAVGAATTEVVNLLSFRRAQFDADFQRALSGTTGALTADIKNNRAATLQAMTTGKYDMVAKATGQALVGPADKSGSGYVVLVTVVGGRSDVPSAQIPTSVRATVTRVGERWLLSDLQNVGIS